MNDAKKAQAVILLAKGKTQAQAADAVGVHEVTMSRWLDDEAFRVEVVKASLELWDLGGAQMSGLFLLANEKAREMLQDNDLTDYNKLQLIRAVWGVAPKVFELAQINATLERIEEEIGGNYA